MRVVGEAEYLTAEELGDDTTTSNGPGPTPKSKTTEGDRASRKRFVPVPFDKIKISTEREWLIEDILPADGTAMVYGDSGTGKSFMVADMALHVALGRPWAGKKVTAGTVVYIIGESPRRFCKRLVAFRQHHEITKPVPFYLVGEIADLGQQPGDVDELISRLREEMSGPISLIVLDTLARMTPGADEGSARDMGLYIAAKDKIGAAFGCLCLTVHHTGKEASRGARGSSAIRAAMDVEILVEGSEGERSVTLTKSRDGEAGLSMTFDLEVVDIEVDDATLPQTSCIVRIGKDWGNPVNKPSPGRKLSDRQKLALEVLTDLSVDGKALPPQWGYPVTLRGVGVDAWRNEMLTRGVLDNESKNPRADFIRVKDSLKARHLIGERDGDVWKA